MVNLFPRTRQERLEYGEHAVSFCESGDVPKIEEMFGEDFFFWNEKHFKLLPNAVISRIRNKLVQESIPIKRRAGLRMSTAFSKYVSGVREEAHDQTEKTGTEMMNRTRKVHVLRAHGSDTKEAGPLASSFKISIYREEL